MIRWLRVPLASVGLLLGSSALALADTALTLDAAEWSRPRSGATVVAMPTLRAAVHDWSQRPAGELLLRHPPGEAGLIWAEELRDWLVALGVPASAIELTASGRLVDQIELSVRRGRPAGE